ncbi:hypothetical protein [Jannaschia sp. R86511]|uniref:hypothetical protein n=1 Tax=Jannaschia sp. R86511 TaxID=3093853 RepID=UPI0036D3DEB8
MQQTRQRTTGTGAGACRAVLLAATVVGLAAGGHLLAGGAAPSWQAVVLSLLVVAVLSTAAASRRVPVWRLVAVVGGGQAVLHHALTSGTAEHHAVAPDPGMVAAHAVATLVTVLAVRWGEAVLRTLLAWALRTPLRVPGPVLRPAGPTLSRVPGPVPSCSPPGTDPARGPPRGFALAA